MRPCKIAAFLSLAALAAGLSSPARAQAAPPPGQDETTITVVGRELDEDKSNASVSTIDDHAIERAQNGALADLLARLPGVGMTRNGGLGGFTGIRIRGADAEQTLAVIDGVRVGDPSSPGGGFDFGNLMLGSASRIELLRGANSLAWGSQAIGGVVAVTSFGDARPEGGLGGRIAGEVGARDTLRAQGRLVAAPTGSSLVGIGAAYVRTDGISSAARGSERDGYRQYSLNLGAKTAITDTLEVRTFGLLADSRVDLDGFAPPSFSFGDTAEYQETREHYAGATLEHRLTESSIGPFSHRLQFGLADINRDNFNPAFDTAPAFRARGRAERLNYSLDWTLADAARLVAGAEREWSQARTDDGFAPDAGRSEIDGLFALALLAPAPGLSVTAGVRHDDHSTFGGATSFALDAGQAIGDTLVLRASYREGFKAPTLFQLSGAQGAFGNPALEPERARSYEIGMRLENQGEWHIDAAVFRRDSRNLIDFVSCPAGAAPLPLICAGGARPFGTYDNINRARSEGLEIEGEARLLPGLRLAANYSFTSVKDRTRGSVHEGRVLARRPRHLANAEIGWIPGGMPERTDISLAIRYAGPSFDDRANRVRLGGYWLADLRLRYPLTPSVDLFGRIENLLDEDYQTVAGYATEGRSAFVGARWAF